jgi:hypothetical protein
VYARHRASVRARCYLDVRVCAFRCERVDRRTSFERDDVSEHRTSARNHASQDASGFPARSSWSAATSARQPAVGARPCDPPAARRSPIDRVPKPPAAHPPARKAALQKCVAEKFQKLAVYRIDAQTTQLARQPRAPVTRLRLHRARRAREFAAIKRAPASVPYAAPASTNPVKGATWHGYQRQMR